MSDLETNAPVAPDTEQERWLKYGANVAVTIALVIAIVVVAILIAQKKDRRLDTTSAGEFSLHPQTLNVIRDLKQPVKLVSLYTKASAANRQTDSADYAGTVADLLEEYKRSGRDIDVEFIDPQEQPGKCDDLLKEVTDKYGGEVARYRDFMVGNKGGFPGYKASFADFRAFATAETAKLPPFDPMKEGGIDALMQQVSGSLSGIGPDLDAAARKIAQAMDEKVPDYKKATQQYDDAVASLSAEAGGVSDGLKQIVGDPRAAAQLPPAVKQYMADAVPRYAAVKVKADAIDAEFKKLGELKVDDVKQKVHEANAILVLGPKEMQTLSMDQVWQADTDRKQYANTAAGTDAKVKPKFIGEQQVTGALLAVTATHKPRAVFVRPGGAPLTSPGYPPFQPAGPFSHLADRLRMYNFEVLEKDASGQYAAEAQMQGGQVTPDPTEDEIKDAVWVVLDIPMQQRQQMPGMPPPASPIDPMLARHLAAGGSAVVLTMTGADKLATALGPWGIDVHTDVMAVHEAIKTDAAAASSDQIEGAPKKPPIWLVTTYGDSPIAAPLKSLASILVQCAPVTTTAKPGYAATALLPLPQTVPSWGAHDIEAVSGDDPIKFDAAAGDFKPASGPLFGGAAVQGPKDGRVVVIAALPMAANSIMDLLDPYMRDRNIRAARFPGNAELLCNSVFWAGHMDQLIAISPAAMDVSRIGTMSDAALRFWRVGLLLVGLPGLVVAAGVGVYFVRRS